MHVRIIAIGKLKHKTFVSLAQDYIARLSHWRLEITELKTDKDIEKHIPEGFFTVVLDEMGEEMNSKKFAEFVETRRDSGDKICFVIGGAYGFPEEFKNGFDMRLSFGKMTFTHQFARVLLLEQLYRAHTIMSGKEYHY